MTKKQTLFFGFTVLLIAVIFTMAGCGGNDPGNGNNNQRASVVSNFRFRNATPNAAVQARMSIARNVTGPGGTTYEVDESSFAEYTKFYNETLGGGDYFVRSITPTKFILPVSRLRLYGERSEVEEGGESLIEVDLINAGNGVITDIDFVRGITVNTDNIEPGTYSAIQFEFYTTAVAEGRYSQGDEIPDSAWHYAKIEFPWPTEMNTFFGESVPAVDQIEQPNMRSNSIDPKTGIPVTTHIGGNIATFLQHILPGTMQLYYQVPATLSSFSTLIYVGDEYKFFAPNTFSVQNYFPSAGQIQFGSEVLVIPFEPVVIMEDTESVTFEVRWDMTGLVEQYKGRAIKTNDIGQPIDENGNVDETPPMLLNDTQDDEWNIFLLKNKFWEGLSITAVVE